jgi:peptide deformylase
MILPIYIYGHPVLRKVAQDIDPANYSNLKELIDNMFETMYGADGVGLAGPQVGLEDRIFVVVSPRLPMTGILNSRILKKAFINAHIIERSGELDSSEEGCLSIPGIHEKVSRESQIRIQYIDEDLHAAR